MAEQITPEAQIAPEPELRRRFVDPKGVLQKNMKLALYLGAALLVILAAVFSSIGKKTPGSAATAKNQTPQPAVQDNTDNNVAELKSQLQVLLEHALGIDEVPAQLRFRRNLCFGSDLLCHRSTPCA